MKKKERDIPFKVPAVYRIPAFVVLPAVFFLFAAPRAGLSEAGTAPAPVAVPASAAAAAAAPAQAGYPSRIGTLYALDPLLSVMSLLDGGPGRVFRKNAVYNRQSHIDYSNFHDGEFTVGIEGGETGVIVDLGTEKELAGKYGYEETMGGGQGYASIRRGNGGIAILADRKTGKTTRLREAGVLFEKPAAAAASRAAGGASQEAAGSRGAAPSPAAVDLSHARVVAGHIYMARITDRHDKNFELIVKIIVIAHRPGEEVTFRWDVL